MLKSNGPTFKSNGPTFKSNGRKCVRELRVLNASIAEISFGTITKERYDIVVSSDILNLVHSIARVHISVITPWQDPVELIENTTA